MPERERERESLQPETTPMDAGRQGRCAGQTKAPRVRFGVGIGWALGSLEIPLDTLEESVRREEVRPIRRVTPAEFHCGTTVGWVAVAGVACE